MNELIKVEINESDEQIVNAKELWEFLGEPYGRFYDWINAMIEYDFAENIDFEAYTEKNVHANGREYERKNYHLKLSMAKEICMLARTEKGKMARKYFLEIEKAWNDPMMIMARANKIQQKQIEGFKNELMEMKPKAEFYDLVHDTVNTVDMGTVAKILNFRGVGRNKLFEILRGEGILQYDNSPYQVYENKGWFKLTLGTRLNSHGEELMTKKTVVYAKGMEEIAKLLKGLGYMRRDEGLQVPVS